MKILIIKKILLLTLLVSTVLSFAQNTILIFLKEKFKCVYENRYSNIIAFVFKTGISSFVTLFTFPEPWLPV